MEIVRSKIMQFILWDVDISLIVLIKFIQIYLLIQSQLFKLLSIVKQKVKAIETEILEKIFTLHCNTSTSLIHLRFQRFSSNFYNFSISHLSNIQSSTPNSYSNKRKHSIFNNSYNNNIKS